MSVVCAHGPWGARAQGLTHPTPPRRASAGHDSILRWLTMKRGPSLFNLAAADGGPPAMSAAVHGNAAALETLVDVSNLNSQDEVRRIRAAAPGGAED